MGSLKRGSTSFPSFLKSDNQPMQHLVMRMLLIMFKAREPRIQWEPFLWGFGTLFS